MIPTLTVKLRMVMVMMITAFNLKTMVMSDSIARMVALQDLLFTQALFSICGLLPGSMGDSRDLGVVGFGRH